MTEVATANVLQSATVDGLVGDLFTLQDQLVAKVRAAFESRRDRLAAAAPRAQEMPRPPARPPASEAPSTPEPSPAEQRAAAPAPVTIGMIDGPPPPEAPATITRGADGRATVRAVQLTEPLRIDGDLDESVYATVESFSGFLQQVPDEGEPATERTEAWVFFDDTNVYVSARLWDSAPESQWVANEMQRDSVQLINNERFSVAFDTFYDRRNAMVFMVSPIGGFRDEEITDEGRPNLDWNPVWNVRDRAVRRRLDRRNGDPVQVPPVSAGDVATLGSSARTSHTLEERNGVSDTNPRIRRTGHVSRIGGCDVDRSQGPLW